MSQNRKKNTTLFRQVIRFGEAAFKPVIVAMINQPLNIAFFLLSLHNVFFISFWGRTTKTGGCKFTVVEFIERKIWIFGPLNKKQENTVFSRLCSNFQLLLVNEWGYVQIYIESWESWLVFFRWSEFWFSNLKKWSIMQFGNCSQKSSIFKALTVGGVD